MKVKFFMLMTVLVYLQISSGCAGMSDWSYDLPNGYAIWHNSSRNIVCGKEDGESSLSQVTDKYVLEFCYDEQYIGLKCIDDYDDYSQGQDTVVSYYLIDAVNDQVNASMTESEYIEMSDMVAFTKSKEWIPTKPSPENAVYPE